MKLFTIIALIGAAILSSCTGSDEPSAEEENPTLKYNFLWDFSEIEDIAYTYEMSSIETESFGRDEEPYSIKTTVIGDLMVGSHGDYTASLTIRNAHKTLFSLTDEGEWSSAKPQRLNISNVGELTQYSKFNDDRLDAVWDAYLPLPLEEITEGETYKLKMSLPVGMESLKYVNGYNTLTFKGYKTIQNRKCVMLEGNIDVSEVDELEFDGEYSHSMKGTGTYYFDTKDHIYVGADVEITLERDADTGPKEDPKEELFLMSIIKETFKIRLK